MLNLSRLQNVRPQPDGSFIAGCPACAQAGKDRAEDNLRIFASGAFHCISGSHSDPGHNAVIHRLAGAAGGKRGKRASPTKAPKVINDWMPGFDPDRRARALESVVPYTVAELQCASPWPQPDLVESGRVLMMLFRACWTPLVWAPNPYEHFVVPVYDVENAAEVECVCPNSPAGSGESTPRSDGSPSPACEANVPDRHFIITEFDAGPLDEQAALIWWLKQQQCCRLACVVFSGGKSLHAWWDYRDRPEADALAFLRLAVAIGADPAYRKRSQRTRTPNARRGGKGELQTCLFLDPSRPAPKPRKHRTAPATTTTHEAYEPE